MAGKVTVTVELSNGTKIAYERDWSGGNPAFEGAEAEKAAFFAAEACRASIEATYGTLPKQAVFNGHEGQR